MCCWIGLGKTGLGLIPAVKCANGNLLFEQGLTYVVETPR